MPISISLVLGGSANFWLDLVAPSPLIEPSALVEPRTLVKPRAMIEPNFLIEPAPLIKPGGAPMGWRTSRSVKYDAGEPVPNLTKSDKAKPDRGREVGLPYIQISRKRGPITRRELSFSKS